MVPLDVILEIQDGQLGQHLTNDTLQVESGRILVVGCLPDGMESGRPSYAQVVEIEGRRYVVEQSWRNMVMAHAALKVKWGEA